MAKDTIIVDGEKYKKVGRTPTVIHFILDNSGSMSSVRDATISAFNEYIQSLKADGNKYSVLLTKFADYVDIGHQLSINAVPELSYENYSADGASTSLYDAVCSTLKAYNVNAGKLSKHLVVILTDGMENSSREYTEKDLRDMKAKLEKQGNWTFVFLGANQDSWDTASKWGFSHSNVGNFVPSGAGMRSVSANLAQSTANMAASGSLNTSDYFTPQQQQDLEEAK